MERSIPDSLSRATPVAVRCADARAPEPADDGPGRIVVVAITRAGAQLAGELAQALPGASLYIAPRWQAAAGPVASQPLVDLREAVGAHFTAGDRLVVFAAVGVVVRLIAPHLRDKRHDPGVVAVDDAGRYAVCVLSGHQGGGNALAKRVATALGAEAVITTASEAHGLPAVDLLGQRWGWRVEGLAAVKTVAAALVNNEPVGTVQEAGQAGWWPADAVRLQHFVDLEALAAANLPGIVVTDRAGPEQLPAAARWVVVRPRTLALGVGASTGVPAEEIDALARAAVADAGFAWASVGAVATLDRKVVEPGIAAFAARQSLPLHGYPGAALAGVEVPHPSAVVAQHVGTASVCEAAALHRARGGRLVASKRKSAHATVALARCQGGLPDETAPTSHEAL